MKNKFYYLSQGKLYKYDNGASSEIQSVVLESYLQKVRESAKRREWKHNGNGAAFTDTLDPSVNPENAVNSVYSRVSAVCERGGELFYSIEIDRTNGIYKKNADDQTSEGIVLCSVENRYYDFDICGDKMAVSVAFAGESNIGIFDMKENLFKTYTEGHTLDRRPVFSATDKTKIYFSSQGLPIKEAEVTNNDAPKGYGQIVSEMYNSTESVIKGPSSICLIDTQKGELTEVLADDRYDYLYPYSAKDGSLYYVRKPYAARGDQNPFGIIGDILLFPFRIIRALFNFLNVFSATYSGKTLTKSRDTKFKDEKKTFIEGNLINAEKELRENSRRGEKNPGIIPRSWELHRMDSFGNDTVLKRGVLAYAVDGESGEVIYSNGSAIISLSGDGEEKKLLSENKVTFIRLAEGS